MSQLIDTTLGRFNFVMNGTYRRFLFECPDCKEWLPLDEQHLMGIAPIDHQSLINPGCFCTFSGTREFGCTVIAAIQAQKLMGFKPSHEFDENQFGEREL